ncbi:hypothetical protein B7C51_25250 (plasmid) [Paenibacillus larvae subsp. pulvifaciens]|uniref:Phage tail tape measure protein domain-containing protein n=1 Tax=Paenibacillus larvae subsp. pulvifaciens TaxID=1477 RepID=A0A1V0V0V5_9BACL|nr:phage tail tape measure protein [Paenibacillus larvae]ARF70780.1 hypothetical protein B7C51_25250 [Paenibacillus larvae subsp. pulvifaciens]
MQRAGGSVNALGIPFEKASSWIATLSARTREGAETIGNSIKSIMARVQSLKERGFVEEDGTKMNQVTKALANIGIDPIENGTFKRFDLVLDELGNKWTTLSDKQQKYIATTVAGNYQYSRFMNIMAGYTESMKLYQDSLTKNGIAQERFNIYLTSTEAHLERMRNAWRGVWNSTFDSQGIRGVIDVLAELGKGINSLVDKFGLFVPTLNLGAIALAAFSSKAREMWTKPGDKIAGLFGKASKDIQEAQNKTNDFNKSAVIVEGSSKKMATGVSLAGKAFSFLSRTLAPLAILSAIGWAIETVAKAIGKHKAEMEVAENAAKKMQMTFTRNKDTFEKVKNEYIELSKITSDGTAFSSVEQEEKYYQTTSHLAEMLPTVVKEIDEKGRVHLKNADAIEEEIKKAKELAALQTMKDVDSSKSEIVKLQDEYNERLKKHKDYQKQLNDIEIKIKPSVPEEKWSDKFKEEVSNIKILSTYYAQDANDALGQ